MARKITASEIVAVEISPAALITAQNAVNNLLVDLQAVACAAACLTDALTPLATVSMDDKWVRSHGETMTKRDAAAALGYSVPYLNKLIAKGQIRTTPDNRVLTRSACAWACSVTRSPKKHEPRATP